MKNLSLIILVIILFNGCNQQLSENSNELIHFESKKNTPSFTVINELHNLPLLIEQLWVLDNWLILYDRTAANGSFFHVYDRKTHMKITEFGKQGGGPGEASMTSKCIIDKSNKQLFQREDGRRILLKYDLEEAIAKGNTYKAMEYKFSNETGSVVGKIGANLFFKEHTVINYLDTADNASSSIGILKIVNYDNNEEKTIGRHIFDKDDFYDVQACAQLLMGDLAVNDYKNKGIFFYTHWNTMVLFDFTTNTSLVLGDSKGVDHPTHRDKFVYDKFCSWSYLGGITSNNNYAATLFLGGPRKNMTNNGEINNQVPSKVRIFDWDGNPQLELNLGFECEDIDLDNNSNMLYVLDISKDDPVVKVVDLDKIIN